MVMRVYRSTDSSAPVLTGQSGTLVTLLDAVLVNGYGSKTAAGWTKSFSGTNKAAYRQAAGSQHYLRVQDDLGASYGRAYVLGYETMSTVDAGTNPFPSSVQTYHGWGKSSTTDATARPWVIFADDRRFYIFVQTGEDASTPWASGFFGDIISYTTSDAYASCLISRYSTSGASAHVYSLDNLAYMYHAGNGYSGLVNYGGMPRNHSGTYGPVNVARHTDQFKALAGTASPSSAFYAGAPTSGLTYPQPTNSSLVIAPIWMHHNHGSANVVRGHMPGLWAPMHRKPLANNDTFSGTGSMSGKTFEAFNVYSDAQLIVETSDTWS